MLKSPSSALLLLFFLEDSVVRRVLGLSIYIMKNKKEGERINMSDLRF